MMEQSTCPRRATLPTCYVPEEAGFLVWKWAPGSVLQRPSREMTLDCPSVPLAGLFPLLVTTCQQLKHWGSGGVLSTPGASRGAPQSCQDEWWMGAGQSCSRKPCRNSRGRTGGGPEGPASQHARGGTLPCPPAGVVGSSSSPWNGGTVPPTHTTATLPAPPRTFPPSSPPGIPTHRLPLFPKSESPPRMHREQGRAWGLHFPRLGWDDLGSLRAVAPVRGWPQFCTPPASLWEDAECEQSHQILDAE